MIEISIKDAVTPYINSFLVDNPRFLSSLTKSIGWYVQGRIKKLATAKKLSNNWRERLPFDVRKKLDKEAPEQWWGKLRQAIGYQYKDMAVMIGWTSATSAMEGRIQEQGISRTVTPYLRKHFSQKGVPLKWDTKVLRVPARPLFEPAMNIVEPDISKHVDKQVARYIAKGGFRKRAGKGRKYEVFG